MTETGMRTSQGRKDLFPWRDKPRDNRGFYVLFCWGVLFITGWAGQGFADSAAAQQVDVTAGKVIREIRIEGNESVSPDAILGEVQSHKDAILSEKLVSEDARRVNLMPQITSVKWRIEPVGEQVDVIFTVVESQRIVSVSLRNNKNIKSKKLLKELQIKDGDFYDLYLIQRDKETLLRLYHEKGYYYATVEVDTDLLKKKKELVYIITEGPRLRIKKILFEGNDRIRRGKLKGKIKSRAYFPIFHKGRLDDEQLERDRRSLEQYYQDEGFLDAQVSWKKKFNEKRTRVWVTFGIVEGPQYKVASIEFDGYKVLTEEQLRESLKLKVGQPLTKKRRVFSKKAIERAYGREGYIYADVDLRPRYTDQEGEIDVLFQIEEKEKYWLGRVIVQGNYQTQDKVVRREFDYFGFTPGNLYDTDAMERAQKRLSGRNLFEDIRITPVGEAEQERDALIEVTEGRTGLVLFGVGVDTNSGVLGQFSVEQRNFDIARHPSSFSEFFHGESFVGAGQRIRLDIEPGTEVSRGRIRFREPYLFDQPYYLDTNLYLFRRWRESYLERRSGTSLTLGRRFKNDWSLEGTMRFENIRVTDLEDDYGFVTAPQEVQDVEGGNCLTSFRAGVGRNTTDNMFRPTEGYRVNTAWEQVGTFGGDFHFASVSAGGTYYHTIYMDITERKTVWAGQVRGSKIIGDAPVFERFYAGGIGSLRGFDYRGVSPRSGIKDDPIGSDYMMLAGSELTHPLYEETVYGKLFCDTGLVSEGPYRVTVGFGLELVIPQLFQMVPMHFNFGFPVYKDDKDDEELFSFSFGMNF